MRTTKVTVLPYDSAWKADFEEIKKEIEYAIGDFIIGIEHIGSTSVEGMSAKPCIEELYRQCGLRESRKSQWKKIYRSNWIERNVNNDST